MLREDTQRLWDYLKDQDGLAGFILVGGTALSMHLDHRLSEDLDFMYPAQKLPRGRINALKRKAEDAGYEFVANDNPGALLEFEDSGMDYHDYQQDYLVGGVKVTFVAPDKEVRLMLEPPGADRVRVASEQEVFRLKCIASANRSKTRDWFDIYLLLRTRGFEPLDILDAFLLAGVRDKFDIAMMRLTSGKPGLTDEGYESLLDDAPTIEEMKNYFIEVQKEIEVQGARLAHEAFRSTPTQ